MCSPRARVRSASPCRSSAIASLAEAAAAFAERPARLPRAVGAGRRRRRRSSRRSRRRRRPWLRGGPGAGDEPHRQEHARLAPTSPTPGTPSFWPSWPSAMAAASRPRPGDDAGRRGAARLCRPPCTSRCRRCRSALTRALLVETVAHHRRGAGAGLRHRRAAHRRRRAQPARRRRRPHRARGERRSSRPPSPSWRAEGLAVTGPHSADTLFHAEARRTLRCRRRHVSRPGADPAQDARLRPRRQRHPRAAVRAHLARPRHGVRTSPAPARRARAASSPRCGWPPSSAGAARAARRRRLRAMSEQRAAASPDGLPPLREVIRALGLVGRARASGQNFILDLNLTRRIARAAGPLEGRTVVEVGPGPGRPDARAVAGGRRARRRGGARRALPPGAGGHRRALSGPPRRCTTAMRSTPTGRRSPPAAGAKPIIVANLPYNVATCCSSAGSRASPGRPGTRAWC